MNVIISVHGRFHAFELAAGLHRQNVLTELLTTYPGFAVKRLTGLNLPVKSAWWIEAGRRLANASFDPVTLASAFGRFTANHLTERADLLVGWSSGTVEALTPAQASGMKVIIERGSTHIVHQTEVLTKAYADHGHKFTGTSPAMIEREETEYKESDAIAVPSTFAKRTFIDRGFPEKKLIVNPYGVDLLSFSPTTKKPSHENTRILIVGQISIRKGIPDLISAFAQLNDKTELLLVGPIEPLMQKLLSTMPMDRVQVRGAVPAKALPDIYREADIFCLPSLEEGLPLVLLQAMASGLPIVATPETGAEDIITDGKEGRIVAANTPEDLYETLEAMVSNSEERYTMGQAARAKVKDGCSWDDYVNRAMTTYQALVG